MLVVWLVACNAKDTTSTAVTPVAAVPVATIDPRVHEAQAQALAQCQHDFEAFKASPGIRLAKAQELANAGKLTEAITGYNALIAAHGTTAEAATARPLLAAAVKQQAAAEAEQRRRESLGIKALKVNKTVAFGDLSLKVTSTDIGEQWTFDGYGDGYSWSSFNRTAERDYVYLTARISITSTSKSPQLPPVAIYKVTGATMELIGPMSYEFARWEDYGTYLGNYHDRRNDFAYSSTIPFSLGAEIEIAGAEDFAIFMVVRRHACVTRKETKFDNPPVAYRYGAGCDVARTLSVADFDNDYAVIQIFNKNKL